MHLTPKMLLVLDHKMNFLMNDFVCNSEKIKTTNVGRRS